MAGTKNIGSDDICGGARRLLRIEVADVVKTFIESARSSWRRSAERVYENQKTLHSIRKAHTENVLKGMLSCRISNFVTTRSSHQDVREGRTAKTGKTGGWEECNAQIIALQTLRRLGKKAKCKSQPKTLDWGGGLSPLVQRKASKMVRISTNRKSRKKIT